MIANIDIRELSKWINEFHKAETSQDFQVQPKTFNLENPHPAVRHHKVDANHLITKNRTLPPHVKLRGSSYCPKSLRISFWCYVTIKRNLAGEMVCLTKKHGIIAVRLHFTLLCFNVLRRNWSAFSEYIYRLFALVEKSLRSSFHSDANCLQKLGERGKLIDNVHCPDWILGLRHSWLGNRTFFSEKFAAYAHSKDREFNNQDYIRDRMRQEKSKFPNHTFNAGKRWNHSMRGTPVSSDTRIKSL